jgi:hypothetical protein
MSRLLQALLRSTLMKRLEISFTVPGTCQRRNVLFLVIASRKGWDESPDRKAALPFNRLSFQNIEYSCFL